MTVEEFEGLFGKGCVIFQIETTSYVPLEKPESPLSGQEISCSEDPQSSSQIFPDPDQKQ